MAITALPNSVTDTIVSGTPYSMPALTNTATTEYRRVIQSILLYNRESATTNYRITYGSRGIFEFSLKEKETFTVEGLKFVQSGDLSGSDTNYLNTRIKLEVLDSGKTLGANVVVSFTNITITS